MRFALLDELSKSLPEATFFSKLGQSTQKKKPRSQVLRAGRVNLPE
jgi:hypothetical protein